MTRALRSSLALVLLAALFSFVPDPGGTPTAAAASYDEQWGREVGGINRYSSPTLGDVNGDGRDEIVHGAQDGRLHVRNPATGTNIANWPQNAGVAIDSSPAIADVTGNGANEIIVGLGSTWKANQQGGLAIYRRDGNRHCRFTTGDFQNVWTESPFPDGYADGVFSTPAIGDIDGDGRPEIVFGGWDQKVHAIDGDCNIKPGFPYHVDDTVWSSPSLYDVDGDGRLEILIGGDQSPGGLSDHQGGEFRALDWRAGAVVELWRNRTNEVIHSSPAVGDINGDGRVEVVVGGGYYWGGSDGRRVFAWHVSDGSAVPGWAGGKDLGGVVRGSPVLGDLTGNGVSEVVVPSRDGAVYAFRGDGTRLWRRGPIGNCCVPPGALNSTPIVADMTGNGRQDVVFGNAWGHYVLRGGDGAVLAGPLNHGYSSESSPAIGDFGSAGRLLITSGFSQPNDRHRIAAYSVPGSTAPDWAQWRRTATNLGAPRSGGDPLPPGQCSRNTNPTASPSSASAKGYWVLGRDGGIFSYGDTSFHGSLPGRDVTANSVAMAAREDGRGYWVVDDRGLIHAFGAAEFHGDMRGIPLNGPILGLEPTPSGNGYWLLGRDGGIFSFGDASFHGSMGGVRLNAPVISMASTPSGDGYWLLGADGGIFSFGDANFYGSTGGMRLNAPVISMSVHPSGTGYWLLGADGGVFTFGSSARFHGSMPGLGLCFPPTATQLRATATGDGYWLLAPSGGIYSFGDAKFYGAPTGHVSTAVDMAIRP